MSQISHLLVKNKINSIDTDVVLVFQNDKQKPLEQFVPEAYREVVGELAEKGSFNGKQGSMQFIRFGGVMPAENLLLVGAGIAKDLDSEKLRIAFASVYSRLKAEKAKSAAVHFDLFEKGLGSNKSMTSIKAARAMAEGLTLPAYDFDKYKTGEKKEDSREYVFITSKKATESKLNSELKQIAMSLEAISVVRDWSNEPSNYGTPTYFAEESVKIGKKLGLKVKVLGETECKKEKMNLFLGVGQGSTQENKLVIVEYTPKTKAKKMKTLALVGKGITFDSGGISIKPSLRMEEMKHDMTGAATVFGATMLAAMMGCPNRIVTVMAFAENMPAGNAIQPGNVITARSGKTVEILNTDAEGRLILADALDYAQDFNPDVTINAATLTGAVGIALGKLCCAIMGNDDKLIRDLINAGAEHGERMWQLPLWDEYFEDMKSDTADIRNVANDTFGGTIRGGIFLKQFIRKGMRWAHLDIAYSSSATPHAYFPKKGANGQFVRSLAQFAMKF